MNQRVMKIEEGIGVAVGVVIAIGFLIWFLLAAIVDSAVGGGLVG